MIAAEGILTARGGVSSHAALVARQMGKVCVCGAAALEIDYDAKTITVGGKTCKEGDFLSIDGTARHCLRRRVEDRAVGNHRRPHPRRQGRAGNREIQELQPAHEMVLASHPLPVRTNADTPEQTANAVAFGAVGIGLTRTEHMFFEGNRIDAMREMILADNGRSPRSRAGQAAAVSTRRLLRHLQGTERAAGDDPFPRPAAARIPAARQGAAAGSREQARHSRRENHRSASMNCTSSIPCSASAAAGWASSIRKSPGCRRGPCSKPPPNA